MPVSGRGQPEALLRAQAQPVWRVWERPVRALWGGHWHAVVGDASRWPAWGVLRRGRSRPRLSQGRCRGWPARVRIRPWPGATPMRTRPRSGRRAGLVRIGPQVRSRRGVGWLRVPCIPSHSRAGVRPLPLWSGSGLNLSLGCLTTRPGPRNLRRWPRPPLGTDRGDHTARRWYPQSLSTAQPWRHHGVITP